MSSTPRSALSRLFPSRRDRRAKLTQRKRRPSPKVESLENRYLFAGLQISVANASVTEGDAGTKTAAFVVSLNAASTTAVTVKYTTANGTAAAGSDYVAKSGAITFAPGVTSATIPVTINGDTATESNETFLFKLSKPVGAVVSNGIGLGTIVDNDARLQTWHLSIKETATLTSSNATQLAVTPSDIFRLDLPVTGGYQYSQYFDGSDVGLTDLKEDVDAFDILPDGSIVISTLGAVSVATNYASPGVGSGPTITATNHDLLKFTPTTVGDNTTGTWKLFLNGAAAGLEADREDIDCVSVLPDGRIILSVSGSASVVSPSGSGGATFGAKDEDLLIYTPSTGAWALYFDGSRVNLSTTSGEDIDGLFVEPSTAGGDPTLYFTTRGNFDAGSGITGDGNDVLRFVPSQLSPKTAGVFDPRLALDGSKFGLKGLDLDGISYAVGTSASTSAVIRSVSVAGGSASLGQAVSTPNAAREPAAVAPVMPLGLALAAPRAGASASTSAPLAATSGAVAVTVRAALVDRILASSQTRRPLLASASRAELAKNLLSEPTVDDALATLLID